MEKRCRFESYQHTDGSQRYESRWTTHNPKEYQHLLWCSMGSKTRKVESQPGKNCVMVDGEGGGGLWKNNANKLSSMTAENEAWTRTVAVEEERRGYWE